MLKAIKNSKFFFKFFKTFFFTGPSPFYLLNVFFNNNYYLSNFEKFLLSQSFCHPQITKINKNILNCFFNFLIRIKSLSNFVHHLMRIVLRHFFIYFFLDNFIDIKYEHCVYPIRIHVYETYNPGGITAIWAGIHFLCHF